jgi:hypothetical protein
MVFAILLSLLAVSLCFFALASRDAYDDMR